MKELFLLDAMALIYRAFFAFSKNPRVNSKGFNTGAILGFTNTLYDVLKNRKPTHIAVAFDTKVPTARHEEFESYKANRPAMPEELSLSIPYIMEVIKAFNIPIVLKDGFEADDVIGTLAKKAEKEGFKVFMMTPDKDFAQLVSENIFMYKPARMGNDVEILGVKEVMEKFEVERPEQVIDFLGLMGDASDNIPGIPGIGEKRAKELLKIYGSVENLIAHADELKGKMKDNVKEFAQQGLDSKRLATIILDVPVDFDEKEFRHDPPNIDRLKELFDELEFRTLAQRIFGELRTFKSKPITEKPAQAQQDLFSQTAEPTLFDIELESQFTELKDVNHEYILVETVEERKLLLEELSKQDVFCFDTETTSIDAQQAELVGIAFSWQKNKGYFLYLPENYNLCLEILEEFKPIFENPDTLKIGQNMKYDISVLKWYEVEVRGKLFDTMIAHYLLEPDKRHNMDVLAETYLKYKPVSIETLIGKKGKGQQTMRQVDKNLVKEYAVEDADVTFQLKEVFELMLHATNTLDLFNNVEMPLVEVLTEMETEGVKLDIESLSEFSLELADSIKTLETDIYQLANEKFNIASPQQLGVILFDKLKVAEKPKLTKTKQYATGEDILTRLVHKHEIVDKILEYRSLTKLLSTYVDSLPKLVNPRTGRVHTSYNQAVASTGRLSSNNPNLQNIPIRTEKGREIRKSFIPRNKDYVLMAADYSQIELRLIAHFADEANMRHDFENAKDIHTTTASRVYGIPEDQVTKDMRRNAKSVNFGIIYGISAFGLSENLNIPRGEAARIISQYFAEYPSIKTYMDSQIHFAREKGYVETILKRRRYLRDINSSNAVVRGFAERNAINAPIQGSSADMIKIAMINILKEMKSKNLDSKMIMQVHDELVFDAKRSELEVLREIVRDGMKNAIQMTVPVEVDVNIGENWLEAH